MKQRRSAYLLEKLEPRLLFSADLALLPLDGGIQAADQDVLLVAPAQLSGDSEQAAETAEQIQREVIFIDAGVEDYQQLLDDIQAQTEEGRQFETVLLDSNRDGITQISDYLSSQQNISAVHIISHGSNGEVVLGDSPLNLSTLDTYAESIEGWQQALTDEADLLFYGCNLASGEEGLTLINSLALLTGADVAASDDTTGRAALGGDWDLEQVVGEIETAVAISTDVQQDWQGLLATLTVTTTEDVVDGDTSSISNLLLDKGSDNFISLREAIIATNSDIGADTIVLGAGTYTLTISGGGDFVGDLDIYDDLSIIGISPTQTSIVASNSNRILDVKDNASINVFVSNLKLEDGWMALAGEPGGALRIEAGTHTPEVTLNNVWITGNVAAIGAFGGAISNAGILNIEN
ncbi:MAG: DUF4347 domain-containing protein, partial [Desulfuromusa sp.]|nr:DUF4347 domain-containing protein [Desulfuromusa sp.]